MIWQIWWMKLVFYSIGLVLVSLIVILKYNKVYLISNIPPKNVRDKDDEWSSSVNFSRTFNTTQQGWIFL